MIPLITTGGSAREIGHDVGRGAREQIQTAAAQIREELNGRDPAEVLPLIGPYVEATEAVAPWLLDELRGMAEGSGVPFETLFALNAGEELVQEAGRRGCSVVGVAAGASRDGHVLLAHNEDSTAGWADLTYVVRAEPTGLPAFAAFAYAGLLLHQGVNAAGIGSVGNALYAQDARVGIPKLLAYRRILAETTMEGAIRVATDARRAFGNNHLLASADGLLFDVEVTGGAWALIAGGNGTLAHTNHLVEASLRGMDAGQDTLNSRLRLHRLEALLEAGAGEWDARGLRGVMGDHANFPGSVCKHHAPESELNFGTIGSVVIDVSERTLWACLGNPCRGAWRQVSA